MTSHTLPMKLVQKLQKDSGGIQHHIDRLEKDNLLPLKWDGKDKVELFADAGILDLVVDYLTCLANKRPAPDKVRLEKGGKVIWKYEGQCAWHLKHLFRPELNEISKLSSVIVHYKPIKNFYPSTVEIECKHSAYKQVNEKIKQIDIDLAACITDNVEVKKKSEAGANKFQEHFTGEFYFKLSKDTKPASLKVFSKTENGIKQGKAEWIEAEKTSFKILSEKKIEPSNYASTKNKNKNETENFAERNNIEEEKTSPRQSDERDESKLKVKETEESDQPDFVKPLENVKIKGVSENQHPEEEQNDQEFINLAEKATSGVEDVISELVDRTEGTTVTSSGTSKYLFQIGSLKVYVYQESITNLEGMDGITNAANDQMMHGGGVAYHISKAAGSKMDLDCKKHVDKNGRLPVTENYVSIPGQMRCKGIIHAVGPKWYDAKYKSDKTGCAKDLYKTILNILEVSKNKGWKTVALTAISSGIFGVPKSLCAEMYIKAIADFAVAGPGSLEEVHFVDINEEILTTVEQTHRKWVKDPESLDFSNALIHAGKDDFKTTGRGQTSKTSSVTQTGDKRPLLTRSSETRQRTKYIVRGKLTLYVYTGSMTELGPEIEALACIAGGALANAIAKAMDKKEYDGHIEKFRNESDREGRVTKLKGSRSLKGKWIFNVFIQTGRHKPDKCFFDAFSRAMRELISEAGNSSNILAMPLIVPGQSKDRILRRQTAQNLVHEIDAFFKSGQKTNLREIHIVDLDSSLIATVKEEFDNIVEKGTGYNNAFGATSFVDKYSDEDNNWTEHEPIKEIQMASLVRPKTAPVSYECPVCFETYEKLKQLPCNHHVCKTCFDKMRRHKPACPQCNIPFETIIGDQPDGKMYFRKTKHSLPGYDSFGTIEILYMIPGGIQSKTHPQPDKPFEGIERRAYLPDNPKGQRVLTLLRKAFDRKLIFTIGVSRTSGKEESSLGTIFTIRQDPQVAQKDMDTQILLTFPGSQKNWLQKEL